MAGVNQFLPFAVGTGANVLTPSAYAALTTLVAQGFQSGIAPSQQVNTPLRQSTFVAAAIAQLIADAGIDANDDGDLTTFKNNLSLVIAMPRGGIIGWPSNTPPSGCLILNGAAISRTAYAFLFSLFGTTFGSGDGSTTFNLPDSRNRALVGAGSLYSIGATGGSKDAVAISHNHTATLSGSGSGTAASGGTHTHTYKTYGLGNNGLNGNANTNSDWGYAQTGAPPNTAEGNHSHSVSVSVSTSGSTDSSGVSGTDKNMMPYFSANMIIKY
jgi:microcystin-dependent protein